MKNDKDIVRIDLTPEQKGQVKDKIGKEADAIEMTVQKLEQRIAPGFALNHSESFLIDRVA